MNTNLIHNVLNIAIAVLAGVSAFLLATGCTTLPTGQLECSQSWIDPAVAALLVTVLSGLKTVINIVRDGFSGLWRSQPPVQ